MYGTSGVIHVWYIRCDSSGVIEMPPPASRQASPATQRRPLGPSDNQAPGPAPLDGWTGRAAGRRRRHLYHT